VPAESKKPSYATFVIVLLLFLGAGIALMVYAVIQWNARARARNLKNPVAATPAALAAGNQIYQRHCQSCHGANGDGKGEKAAELSTAPGDFTNAGKMSGLTDGELYWEITEGRRPMPAFRDKLSEQERWEVVDYIRRFAARSTASRPAARPDNRIGSALSGWD
jgi:mono/diheme cytochrome c family protein